jgi:hypothetical protein
MNRRRLFFTVQRYLDRVALIETADRRQRAAELSNEAAAVAADVDDRREMARVATVMEDLRDPW